MTAPTDHFFIVGAQRCGTTYLCHLLDEHPAIEMARPFRPEPKYFMGEQADREDLVDYESRCFTGKRGARLRGEKSTSYMDSEKAARRIAAWFPQAKIIFLLRDPVARAISHYWFSVRHGLESLPMSEAFRQEDDRRGSYDPRQVSVSPFAYLSRGRYIDALAMYERHFPRDNIAVALHEELVASPAGIRHVYRFLGVDPDFTPAAAGRRVNAGDYESRKLPVDLSAYVESYFAESIAQLSARLGRDLAALWAADRRGTDTASSSTNT